MTTHKFTTALSVQDCQIRLQRFIDTMYMPSHFGLTWHNCPDDTWCCVDDWSGAHFDLHLLPHPGRTDVVLQMHRSVQRWLVMSLFSLLLLSSVLVSLQSVWFIPLLMGLAGGLVALYAQQQYLHDLEIQVVQRVQTALPIDG